MSVNIAPVTLKVAADAEQLTRGLAQAERATNNWAARMTSKVNASLRNVPGSARVAQPATPPMPDTSASSMMGKMMGGNLMAMAGPAAAAVAAVKMVKEKIDAVFASMRQGIEFVFGLLKGLPALLDTALLEPGRLVADTVSGIGRGISSLSEKISKIPGMPPILGGMLSLPVKVVGEAVQLLGAGLGFLWDEFKKGAASIRDLQEASLRTGASINDLRAIMIAAGPAADGVDKAVGKMQRALANAAMGNAEASAAFERLGFAGTTIAGRMFAFRESVQQLAGMKLVDQLSLIGQAITSITDPTLRAKAAMEIFGKAGLSMLPLLARGAEGIERARVLMEKFGLGVTPADAENVRQANLELAKLKMLREGLTNQITLAVAPIIAELSEMFNNSGLSMKNLADTIIDGFEWGARAVARFVDGIREASISLAGMRMASKSLEIGWLETQAAFEGMKGNSDKQNELMAKANAARAALQGMANDVNNFDPDKWSNKVGEFFDKVRDRRRDSSAEANADEFLKNADAMEARAKNAASWFGPEAVQAVVDLFAKARGEALKIKEAIGLQREADKAAATFLKFQDQAKGIAKTLLGPLGEFVDEFNKIREVVASGALSPWKGTEAVGKSFQDFVGKAKLPEVKFAGAAEIGTKEAYSAILEFAFDQNKNDPIEQLKAIQENQLQEAKRNNEIGERIIAALKADPTLITGIS